MNTPEEEVKLINFHTQEIWMYKFIEDRRRLYVGFQVGDIIVSNNSTKQRFKITYIDTKYGLIWGRLILSTGELSTRITHLTSHYGVCKIDPQQITSTILGVEYNPGNKRQLIAKKKRKLYTQRRKQRLIIDCNNVYPSMKAAIAIGQTIWIPHKNDDSDALSFEYTVISMSSAHIVLKAPSGIKRKIYLEDICIEYNIYIERPIVYEENNEI